MPLRNRVDPYGELHAVEARGAWMGNRGVLHDDENRIVARWRSRRWITCVLSFRGRHREVFAPHRYSELFFLDEVTSLAAGHRPCAECRRARYEEFRAAWAAAHGGGSPASADEIDRALHAERVREDGGKKTYRARFLSLSDGVVVEHDGRPHLLRGGKLRAWSFDGYGSCVDPPSGDVDVLTPKSIVRVIQAGFIPQAHETADR
jgi:hypothetical protein